MANASRVWPEGKEGLPPWDSFSMSGYVLKGRSLATIFFYCEADSGGNNKYGKHFVKNNSQW